ncbi:MAG: hypothetical protein HC925_02115 [Coleofasciculaceae cyanobacterium SM2_3_26]|nr:hypothetical protein [Coleofasciculaceae cyanobacterium SM2_3_26]
MENEFWQRANQAIAHLSGREDYGNTAFENEKRSYPYAMTDFLAGNRARAIAFLQQPDRDAEANAHTLGIDFYPSFTLKGQIRKYFFFGEFLDPAYRQRMYDAAKIWTEFDPKGRPHPLYGMGNGGEGWDQQARGGWVDGRNTDNLRAMRDVAVYLMAEETGNESVRLLYKDRLLAYARSLYFIGMGEWDSETYHGHTITAYANLYDFAKDAEVRLLGKAVLDWLHATGALKYWRGAFGGPTKRDYSRGNATWKALATSELGMYFGDSPVENPSPYHDVVHLITSSYRPPLAVVALARKQFDKPLELLNAKPTYENWKPGNSDAPQFHETLYFGHTFQVGTLPRGSGGDWNGFKLMAFNSQRGVDYFIASTGDNPKKISTSSTGADNVAQYRHLILWLSRVGDSPFQFFLPKTVEPTAVNGVWFLKYERTWLALHPINLQIQGINAEATAQLQDWYPGDRILTAKGVGKNASGFALEIGEPETHGTFAEFQQAVLARSHLDVTNLVAGQAEFTGTTGERVKLQMQERGLPVVWRNGKLHNWRDHFALYQNADGSKAPIALAWKQGRLYVEAGGDRFESQLTREGTYSFQNK